MSFLVRPPMNQPNGGPDELDSLFSRFFQSEMPHPWPGCPRPGYPVRVAAAPPERVASWWELSQRFASRLALALSVALLLCASWLLSGSFPQPTLTPLAPPEPAVAAQPIELLPPVAERGGFRVTEQLVQPKDGPTKMIIEIIPPAPR